MNTIADQWGARVVELVQRRREGVDRVLGQLRHEWDHGLTGGGRAAPNLGTSLSGRILHHVHAKQPDILSVRSDFLHERIQELDAEVAPLIARTALDPDDRGELVHLLRRRSRLVARHVSKPAAPVLTAGGPRAAPPGPRKNDVAMLQRARRAEAEQSGVAAVQWRLRDTLRETQDNFTAEARNNFRTTLDDARARAVAALDTDITGIDSETQGFLSRLQEHAVHDATYGQDVTTEVAQGAPDVRAALAKALRDAG